MSKSTKYANYCYGSIIYFFDIFVKYFIWNISDDMERIREDKR